MPTSKNKKKDTPEKPKYKRLDFFARCEIQNQLTANDSVAEIARSLEVSQSTISREIQRNRITDTSLSYAGRSNVCAIKQGCSHKGLCGKCSDRYCRSCKEGCRAWCPDYVKPVCETIQGTPWVCNGCPKDKKRVCRVQRYVYDAKFAQSAADGRLCEARAGVDLTQDELTALDSLITPLVKQGQSLEEIYLTHGDEIPVTIRTLYTYVADNVLPGLCNADLIRKMRYAPRYKKRTRKPRDIPGRTYADFCALGTAVQAAATEMDTVEGRKGGSALLTLYIRRFELMPMFLVDAETHDEIMEQLSWVAISMDLAEDPDYVEGPDGEICEVRIRSFGDFFGVLLTDNGACFLGFADIEELGGERLDGTRKTTVYYCDPYSSFQKGGIERGHEYIREVLPKGTSFDHLKPEDIALLASHVNSIPRPALGGKSPYELALPLFGAELLHCMGIDRIEPDDIIRKPWLLPAPSKVDDADQES
jgi:IS30 family transposase